MNATGTHYVNLRQVTTSELSYLCEVLKSEIGYEPEVGQIKLGPAEFGNPLVVKRWRVTIGPMDAAEYAACKVILRQRFGVTVE